MAVGSLTLAGLPLTAGFVSESFLSAKRLQSGRLDAYLLYVLIALIAIITTITALA